MLRATLFFIVASLCLSRESTALTLALYEFDDTYASADADPTSTASTFTPFGYTNNFGRSTAGGISNLFVRVQVTPGSEAGALGDDEADPFSDRYFSFTLTPTGPLNFDNILLGYEPTGAAFTGTIFARSSLDDFATNLGSYTEAASFNSSYTPVTFDLTGNALYQNITNPVEFRIYFYDDSNSDASTSIVHRVNDLALNGTPVPEPTALVLLAGGTLGLLLRRRRTRR